MSSTQPAGFELRFSPIHDAARSQAFACDARGHVDLDALGERERNRYFHTRTCVGRLYLMPTVRRCDA